MQVNQHTVPDLYRHLFDTLVDLRTKKITAEQANAVVNVAQTIINLGKLECKFIDTIGGNGTGFMPSEQTVPTKDQLRLVNRWPR